MRKQSPLKSGYLWVTLGHSGTDASASGTCFPGPPSPRFERQRSFPHRCRAHLAQWGGPPILKSVQMNCRLYPSCTAGESLWKQRGRTDRHVIVGETMGKRKRNEEDSETNRPTPKVEIPSGTCSNAEHQRVNSRDRMCLRGLGRGALCSRRPRSSLADMRVARTSAGWDPFFAASFPISWQERRCYRREWGEQIGSVVS